MLAALDLAHMRAFNAGQVGQRFLGDASIRAQRTHRRAEGLGQLGVEGGRAGRSAALDRSEEHTSELQSLMRISYAVFCLKKKINDYSAEKQRHHIQNTYKTIVSSN